MTIRVSRVDGVAIPAAQDRRALYSSWTTGILTSGDGLVEAQGTPNMTVKVATIGGLLIDDGVSFGDGKLVLESDAVVNVTIAASDATHPRVDLIMAKVTAVEFGGSNAFTVEAVAGTPAASPSAPAVPTRCYALAEVRVEAGVTTIQANKITDRRSFATPGSARVVSGSGTANLTSGQAGTSTTVSFGTTFPTAPKVVVEMTTLGGVASGLYFHRVTAATTTGFTVFFIKADGSTFGATATVGINWIAAG